MMERELNQHEMKLIENVEEFGCQVTHVFDPKGVEPGFSYSIGFPATVGQPDVIVFGLDSKLMQSMINDTLNKCRAGLQLRDWIRIDDLIDGFECVAREIPSENVTPDYFNSAIWFEKRRTGAEPVRAFQLVWPGASSGLFPWEDGATNELIDAQPALYERSLH